jgi:hypothetical protein
MPRRPSFHVSGPDRLSPHRRPGMTMTREGRVEDWPLSRSVLLRHLLSRARGCAGWRSQRFRVLARPFDEPTSASALLARGVQPVGPLPAPSRDGEDDLLHPRCLLCWGTPRGGVGPSPANRAKTFASRGVNLCPQVVPKLWKTGPRLFHPNVVPCSDGAAHC